jgi:A/G-specific adenine glycosylase
MAPRKKPTMVVGSKTTVASKRSKSAMQTIPSPTITPLPATPPARAHQVSYHYPLLLSDRSTCDALLSWFEGVEETRSMPWRKSWLNPNDYQGREEELGRVLSKRAYEVWVSEVSK